MRGFPGTDGNGPARQFLFHVAYDGGGIAGNDQFLVLDLVGDAAFFNKHAHIIVGELACRPGGEYGQSLGVFDKRRFVLNS